MQFLRCEKCGNFMGVVKKTACTPMCCGETMTIIEPNTTDAAGEKHVPVVTVDGCLVTVVVGSVEHPMTPEHFIEWIAIKTKKGAQRKVLTPADAPKAVFALTEDDEFEEAYAYCNLHSLWKSE